MTSPCCKLLQVNTDECAVTLYVTAYVLAAHIHCMNKAAGLSRLLPSSTKCYQNHVNSNNIATGIADMVCEEVGTF